MMIRRLIFAFVASALALAVLPHYALAAGSHLEQAIAETKEAIHEGKQDHPTSLVEHAVNAIDHAKAAQVERPDPHIKAGIKDLKKAVTTAKRSGRPLTKAVKHAQTALTHFEAAK